MCAQTWDTPYLKVTPGLYTTIEKKFKGLEVQHTDGIGTKGIFHWQRRTFKNAVLDALAMNLNDLAMVGATPYAIQNHIVLPKDDHKAILEIVRALAHECRKRKIAMTGGETSIHNDSRGMDISITVSGFLKKQRKKNECEKGDVLIGLRSTGLHSNGITKARAVFKDVYRKEFTTPTRIYADKLLPLLSKSRIHGMMHITGGAFAKLKDILGANDAMIKHPKKLWPQKIFFDLYRKGVPSGEMYRTFNCGIGFVLSVAQKDAKAVLKRIRGSAVIGEVVEGSGKVNIHPAFNNKHVIL